MDTKKLDTEAIRYMSQQGTVELRALQLAITNDQLDKISHQELQQVLNGEQRNYNYTTFRGEELA
jgi:hypothetical protein